MKTKGPYCTPPELMPKATIGQFYQFCHPTKSLLSQTGLNFSVLMGTGVSTVLCPTVYVNSF